MWVLVNQKNLDISYALCPGETYKVGRLNVDILIRDDTSVSRVHGKFIVVSKPEIPRYQSQVFFEDLGSSYGSYVGDEAIASSDTQDPSSGQPSQKDRLAKGEKTSLTVNTRIRIGLFSTIYRLEWRPLVVSSSTLKTAEKRNICDILKKIGSAYSASENKIVDSWSDEVTHLVMKTATLTLKVANALAKGIPIITPDYLKDFRVCVSTKQILPDPRQFLPPLAENTINVNEVTLAVKKDRQRVFKGRLLAFATEDQLSKFEQCINYGGGQAAIFGTPESNFRDPNIFKLANNLLIQPEKPLSALPTEQRELWQEAQNVLASSNFKMIPVSAIGLAILNCSTKVFCNPDKQILVERRSSQNRVSTSSQSQDSQVSEVILAPETQAITQTKNKKGSDKSDSSPFTAVIPETLPSSARSQPVKTNEGFRKPESNENFGDMSVITKATQNEVFSSSQVSSCEVENPVTSTPAMSQEMSAFWDVKNNTQATKAGEDDFFAFDENKKRKKNSGNGTSKRPRTEASLEIFSTQVLTGDATSKKRQRADNSSDNETAKKSKIDNTDNSTSKALSTTNNVENVNKYVSDLSVVDEFGFIGKSSNLKKETTTHFQSCDSELSKNYSNVKLVSLVIEKPLFHLKLDGMSHHSNQGSSRNNNTIKKFKKQPLKCCDSSQLINCKIIEEESNDVSIVMDNDETVKGPTLDNWVIREKEMKQEQQESENFWNFANSQSVKSAKKRK